jgi:hypothetical protein
MAASERWLGMKACQPLRLTSACNRAREARFLLLRQYLARAGDAGRYAAFLGYLFDHLLHNELHVN